MAAEVSFTLGEQDCVDAARGQYWQRLRAPRQLGSAVASLALLAILFGYLDSDDLTSAFFATLVYSALMLVIWLAVVLACYLSVGRHARRMFRQQIIKPDSRVSWTANGFSHENDHGSFAVEWRELYGWGKHRGNYMLYINEGFFYLIPKHAVSPDQAIDLEEALATSALTKR